MRVLFALFMQSSPIGISKESLPKKKGMVYVADIAILSQFRGRTV